MPASKPLSKTSTMSAKPLPKTPGKAVAKPAVHSAVKSASGSAAKNTSAKLGRVKPVIRAAARKAVVLGQVKAANGKFYQVLAPAAGPRHLSSEDVQQAVKLMVSAR